MAQTSSIELTDAETKKNLVSSTLSFKKRVNDDSDGVMWYEKLPSLIELNKPVLNFWRTKLGDTEPYEKGAKWFEARSHRTQSIYASADSHRQLSEEVVSIGNV